MEFVDRVISILKEKKITQKELCVTVGIYPTSLTDWRNKNTIPSADVALRIADFLGVSLRYLVFGDTKDNAVLLTDEQKDLLEKWQWIPPNKKNVIMSLIDVEMEDAKSKGFHVRIAPKSDYSETDENTGKKSADFFSSL